MTNDKELMNQIRNEIYLFLSKQKIKKQEPFLVCSSYQSKLKVYELPENFDAASNFWTQVLWLLKYMVSNVIEKDVHVRYCLILLERKTYRHLR